MKQLHSVAIVLSVMAPYRVPLFNALRERLDIDITVFETSLIPPKAPDIAARHGQIRRVRVPGISIRARSPGFDTLSYDINPGLVSRMLSSQFDFVVCLGWTSPPSMLASFLRRARHQPVLLWEESIYHPPSLAKQLLFPVVRALVQNYDAYLAASSRCISYLRWLGADDSKIFLFPLLTDHPWFTTETDKWRHHRPSIRSALQAQTDRTVLFVGQLIERKGVRTLLDAIRIVRDGGINADLVIAGQGRLEPELRAYCLRHNLTDRVHFTGFIRQNDLPRLYASADVFVLPSLYDAFGVVVNEAMAAGLPVIASSEVGAVGDLVRDGENGIVVPPNNPELLASAIARLLTDTETRDAMAERSRQIIDSWNTDRAADGMLGAFLAAVASQRP